MKFSKSLLLILLVLFLQKGFIKAQDEIIEDEETEKKNDSNSDEGENEE